MVRPSSPAATSTQPLDSMQEEDLLSSGSEQSPGSPSELTAPAGAASGQTDVTGATIPSGPVAREQLASARAALRRRDRRIASLSRQVAALQQQLSLAGGGGEVALYHAPGALAPVSAAEDADEAAPEQVERGSRFTPAVTLSMLLAATLLCWLFLA